MVAAETVSGWNCLETKSGHSFEGQGRRRVNAFGLHGDTPSRMPGRRRPIIYSESEEQVRHAVDIYGASHLVDAQQFLDSAQHVLMSIKSLRQVVGLDLGTSKEICQTPATIRRVRCVSLVPPQDQHSTGPKRRVLEQWCDVHLQPLIYVAEPRGIGAVRGAVGTLVAIIDDVRDDEGEIG